MITFAELDAIAERSERATPGPWRSGSGGVLFARCCDPMDNPVGMYASPYGIAVGPCWKPAGGYLPDDEVAPTADFIASARADVPALVAEVRQLRSQLNACCLQRDGLLLRAEDG